MPPSHAVVLYHCSPCMAAPTLQHLVELHLCELLDLNHVVPRCARGCTKTATNLMQYLRQHESDLRPALRILRTTFGQC